MLVTPAQALQHLRVDGVADAADIALKTSAAEIAASDYMARKIFPDQVTLDAAVTAGTAGPEPMVVNDLVRAAILLILGHLYANREDVITGVSAVQIPMGSCRLLDPYKRIGI